MYTALVFNINVSSSVTAQGRALISSASMFFESFMNNNVKFGSLNEVLTFIRNVCSEERKYEDYLILDYDKYINPETCFNKVIMSCGYRWIPDEDEMDIVWRVISNLGQIDLNRVYYKNNLFGFLDNSKMQDMIRGIMSEMESPYLNPLDIPKGIEPIVKEFAYILKEYVYYGYMYIDRIDRCDNMIKSVIAVSDTDSCIVSFDGWYRYCKEIVKDIPLKISKYPPINPLDFIDKDEFGDFTNPSQLSPLDYIEKESKYDFTNDKIVEEDKATNPLLLFPPDYLKYSIVNIMSYVVDLLINDYMEKFTKNNHSFVEGVKCRIIMKNEFFGK